MMIILPSEANESKVTSFESSHPKTGEAELYFHDDEHVYQLTKYDQPFGSWFVDDSVKEEASLFFLTRFDELFLAIPHLLLDTNKFRALDDLLENNKNVTILTDILQKANALERITDVKVVDDEKYYKYNERKALSWLERKMKSVSRVLKDKQVNVSKTSAGISGFLSDDNDEEMKLYAFELIEQYLPDTVSQKLRKHVNIPDIVGSPLKANNLTNKKRSLDELKPKEDYFSGKQIEIKKVKLTRAQQQLAKDSKNVKSVASFFTRAKK
ncbi:Ribonuclease H2 subunit B [Halotydeus destructor]|nr:Ribonuclease H2 subunit B [Halotydeus destructor]